MHKWLSDLYIKFNFFKKTNIVESFLLLILRLCISLSLSLNCCSSWVWLHIKLVTIVTYLGVCESFNRVSLHFGCVDGVISVALKLKPIANVDTLMLLLLSKETNCTGPCVALGNNYTETLFASSRICCLVQCHVTH